MSAHALDALVRHGVVPVVRTPDAVLARRAVDWLRDAGIATFEITLTIPGALALVRELAPDPALHVGVGTVLDAAQAAACVDAGARYVVSPAVLPDVVAPCREAGVPCLLGAATPTEVLAAARAGCDAVKVFPVSSLGGAAHVKALKAVFPDVALVPTGGIGPGNVLEYLQTPAVLACGGSWLTPKAAIDEDNYQIITDLAAEAVAIAVKTRG